MKIIIVGGDARMKIAKDEFIKAGYDVDTLGLYENDSGNPKNADVVILPVPTTKDGVCVYTPLTNRVIPLSDIENLDSKILTFTANYRLSRQNNTDICALDEYALLNAVPTAEGVISYAIEHTDITLWNSKVLVIGYGRIGKILTKRLLALCADVTVSARKAADFALLDTDGIKHIYTSDVCKYAEKFDIIFNTVDAPVLEWAQTGSLIIDVSSKGCGGSKDSLNIVKLPGLPGKTAPLTAGKIITQTVIQQIDAQRR